MFQILCWRPDTLFQMCDFLLLLTQMPWSSVKHFSQARVSFHRWNCFKFLRGFPYQGGRKLNYYLYKLTLWLTQSPFNFEWPVKWVLSCQRKKLHFFLWMIGEQLFTHYWARYWCFRQVPICRSCDCLAVRNATSSKWMCHAQNSK